MAVREMQCWSCKHFHRENENATCCNAFPNPIETDWSVIPCAIPHEIIDGTFDHTNPYPGDNGIRYEPVEK